MSRMKSKKCCNIYITLPLAQCIIVKEFSKKKKGCNILYLQGIFNILYDKKRKRNRVGRMTGFYMKLILESSDQRDDGFSVIN